MRIALDALGLVPGEVGGMEAYVRSLVKGLAEAGSAHKFLLCIGHEAAGTFPPAATAWEEFVADAAMPPWLGARRYPQSAWQVGALARKLRAWRYDVIHCMMTLPKPPWGAKHMVLTIHDLNFEFLPDLWARGEAVAMKALCRLGTRVAEKILTASHHAKQTIVERYGVPEDRIAVVYSGVDMDLLSLGRRHADAGATLARFRLPEHFILFPANTWPHKNHVRLLEALAILRDEYRLAPCLVLTGTERWGHRQMVEAIARFHLNDQVRWLGFVHRHELVALYGRADALVFPSLYEGFGIPVIEAMACGCPAACSQTTATGEVAGGAALVFDPEDPADIGRAVASILTDEHVRQNLIAEGRRRAADFSLDRMARETLNVYEEVASGRGGPAGKERAEADI